MQSLLAMRNPRADIRWNIKPWVDWVCFAVMSLHSHACHRLWIKSRQIPLLIYYKTLNQLHVQLIHTLIHKSTRNNICFFLPEIHSFLFFGNPPGNSKSSNHPIFHFIHENSNVSELMQCMCFQLCIGVWIITACIAFWIVQNLKFLKWIVFVYISKANEYGSVGILSTCKFAYSYKYLYI